jgi:mannose-6-phosphate isomerase-like protein (cupin superfamily)
MGNPDSFDKSETREEYMKKAIGGVALCVGLSMLALSAVTTFAQEKEIHRVVTAIDKDNKSVALFDGKVPLKIGGAGEGVANLWVTQKAPADFSWTDDRAAARKSFAPSNGGTYLLVVDFPPAGPEVDKLDVNTMMNVVGADAPKRGVPPSNPLMHRTRTVDYAIVMSGEIDMMLDTGTVHLKAGDVVVQQATNHAWLNHSKEPCRIAFVLMDSQEP